MSENPFEVIEGADPSASEYREPDYPLLQWLNTSPKARGKSIGIMNTGGFLIPRKQWRKASSLPEWPVETVEFDKGSDDVRVCAEVDLAVIRSRKCWSYEVEGRERLLPWQHTGHDNVKKRGRYQYLIVLRGCRQLFQFTTKNHVGMAMEAAITEHEATVISEANKIAAQERQSYAFYLRLRAGNFIEVGKKDGEKSKISPPALVVPDVISREFLVSMFVGKDALLWMQSCYRQNQRWSDRWNDPKNLSQSHDTGDGGDANDWACGGRLADAYGSLLVQIRKAGIDINQWKVQLPIELQEVLEEHWSVDQMKNVIEILKGTLKQHANHPTQQESMVVPPVTTPEAKS